MFKEVSHKADDEIILRGVNCSIFNTEGRLWGKLRVSVENR